MLHILYGEDTYSRQEALAGIKAALGDPQLLTTSTSWFSGQELSPAQLSLVGNASPFLTSHRLIIVEGLLARFELPRGNRRPPPTRLIRDFTDAIRPLPPTTVLVLLDGPLRQPNALLPHLTPQATVKVFPRPKREKLLTWIQDYVAKGGGSISPEALHRLVNEVGEDLWTLSSEIEKLLLYAPGQAIQPSHIQELVPHAREANVFHLVDAILQRHLADAGQWLHQLLAEGMAPGQLLALLARQLRLIVQAQDLLPQNLSTPELQSRLGLPHEFALRRTLGQARQYPISRVSEAYHRLLETDLAIKTGEREEGLALDLLIAELAQPKAKYPFVAQA